MAVAVLHTASASIGRPLSRDFNLTKLLLAILVEEVKSSVLTVPACLMFGLALSSRPVHGRDLSAAGMEAAQMALALRNLLLVLLPMSVVKMVHAVQHAYSLMAALSSCLTIALTVSALSMVTAARPLKSSTPALHSDLVACLLMRLVSSSLATT